jgi:hypothetical protein
MSSAEKDSDSCDTLPPARLPPPISFPPRWPSGSISPSSPPSVLAQPDSRKLCVRHQRIADEGTNLKLQQVRSLVFSPSSPLRLPCDASTLSFITRRNPPPPVLTISPPYLRPSTTSRSKNENPLMQYGLASRPHHIPAENLFCEASLPCAASLSSPF